MNRLVWLVFVGAALLEVGGDAVTRKGLHGRRLVMVAAGFVILACCGVVVNIVRGDFPRLLGVYMSVSAPRAFCSKNFCSTNRSRLEHGSGLRLCCWELFVYSREASNERSDKNIFCVFHYPIVI